MRMGCLPWLVCSLLAWTNAYTVEELLTDTVDMVENIAEAVPNEITNVKHKLYKHSLGAFHDFMKKHNKTYATQHEYKHRYRTLRNNMKKVYEIQALEQGSTVYGATRLADLTEEEFKTNYLGFNKLADIPDITLQERNYLADIPYIPLPGSFDWRDQGAVTKAKNQEMTGNIQGQNAILASSSNLFGIARKFGPTMVRQIKGMHPQNVFYWDEHDISAYQEDVRAVSFESNVVKCSL